jgi:hypothetical protein
MMDASKVQTSNGKSWIRRVGQAIAYVWSFWQIYGYWLFLIVGSFAGYITSIYDMRIYFNGRTLEIPFTRIDFNVFLVICMVFFGFIVTRFALALRRKQKGRIALYVVHLLLIVFLSREVAVFSSFIPFIVERGW